MDRPHNIAPTYATDRREICLKYGQFEAGIIPDLGGCLSYFRQIKKGVMIDWLRPMSKQASSPLESSCFTMAPFFSWLENDRFSFANKKVQLKTNGGSDIQRRTMHGFAWQQQWKVLSCSQQRLILEVVIDDSSWPWLHRVQQDICLTEKGLIWTVSVHNLSDTVMPVGLGFHPFFENPDNVCLKAQCSAMHIMNAQSLPESVDEQDSALLAMRYGSELPRGYDNVFQGFGGEFTLVWPDKVLSVESSEELTFLTLYSPHNSRFFCVEPVSHTTNAFNLKDTDWSETGFRTLAPDASLTGRMCFYPQ